jgi:hypothetical protein
MKKWQNSSNNQSILEERFPVPIHSPPSLTVTDRKAMSKLDGSSNVPLYFMAIENN